MSNGNTHKGGDNKTTPMSKIKGICKNIVLRPSSPIKKTSSSSSPISFPSPSSSSSSNSRPSLSESRDDIEKVFRYIDEDGDGKISPAELQRCVKAVGAQRLSVEEAAAAVECSDSDGDGFLSLQDFERLMEGNDLSKEEKVEELKKAFVMYNDKKDGSGVITPKSLKKMMGRLGETTKTIEDCEVMIKGYDLDGNGVLDFQEFVVMMS